MNDNEESKRIMLAPRELMFNIFINTLVLDNHVKFYEKSSKVLLLDNFASNYFVLGRDEKMIPFIGVQESMVPWFYEMPWRKIAICPNERYVYLVAEEEGELRFIFGMKPRAKRMIALFDPKKEKIDKQVASMKIFKMIKKKLAVSEISTVENIPVIMINSVDELIVEEDFDKPDLKTNDDEGFKIMKRR
jgi:hypothetical protein